MNMTQAQTNSRNQANNQGARDSRESREQESHESDVIHETYGDVLWSMGNNLPHIEPRKGYVQRWVRAKIDGDDDDMNIYKKQNQGWEPRKYSTVPKKIRLPKTDFEGTEVIGMKTMILMERPAELHKKFSEMRRSDILRQEAAVANDVMKIHDPSSGMGKPQTYNKSEAHTGRVPEIADD